MNKLDIIVKITDSKGIKIGRTVYLFKNSHQKPTSVISIEIEQA